MNQPLEPDTAWLEHIRLFFGKLDREMPSSNAIQAMIPKGADALWNHHGTALGILAHIASPARSRPTLVVSMPGVPKEMKPMFENDILPMLRESAAGAVILSRSLHTFGVGESAIAQTLGDLMKRDRNPSVGTTVSQGIVTVRVNSRSDFQELAQRQLDQTEELVREKLGLLIYGLDDQTLPLVVAQMLKGHPASDDDRTGQQQVTIATAESCTGGLLAKYLTDLSGSSDFFLQGWVTYSNLSKTMLLGVNPRTIETHGAVSEAVVCEMAVNALDKAGSDLAVAISGVAGPLGGTLAKPVGTVCIALASKSQLPVSPTQRADDFSSPSPKAKVLARTFMMHGDREMIRDRAAKAALSMLRFHLLGVPMP